MEKSNQNKIKQKCDIHGIDPKSYRQIVEKEPFLHLSLNVISCNASNDLVILNLEWSSTNHALVIYYRKVRIHVHV
jgi:hypothetical protein